MSTQPPSSFAVAGRQVNARENCFQLGFIQGTAGAADALKAVFASDIPVQKKSDISTALHGLDAFITTAKLDSRIKTLADFTESDLLAYISSIPKERKQKREQAKRRAKHVLRRYSAT